MGFKSYIKDSLLKKTNIFFLNDEKCKEKDMLKKYWWIHSKYEILMGTRGIKTFWLFD